MKSSMFVSVRMRKLRCGQYTWNEVRAA